MRWLVSKDSYCKPYQPVSSMNYVAIIIILPDFVFKFDVCHIYILVGYREIYNMSRRNDGNDTKFHSIY